MNQEQDYIKRYVRNEIELREKFSNLGEDRTLFLFRETDKGIKGFLVLSRPNILSLILVHPTHHQKQIGSNLISYLQSKTESIKTIIDALNTKGIEKLLKKNGFRISKSVWIWKRSYSTSEVEL